MADAEREGFESLGALTPQQAPKLKALCPVTPIELKHAIEAAQAAPGRPNWGYAISVITSARDGSHGSTGGKSLAHGYAPPSTDFTDDGEAW